MDKLLEKIEQKILLPGAVASIAIMTCLTTFDAGGRYLLNSPIDGAYEITERYLMVCCFYFSITYAYRKGANIRLTLLTSRLPGRIALGVNYMVQIIAILYCSYLLVGALQLTLQRIGERIFLAYYSLPLAPVYILIPMGLTVLILRMILDLWRVKSGKSGLFAEGGEDDSIAG